MAVNQLQTREQNPKHEKEVRFDIVQSSCVDLLSSHVLGTSGLLSGFRFGGAFKFCAEVGDRKMMSAKYRDDSAGLAVLQDSPNTTSHYSS